MDKISKLSQNLDHIIETKNNLDSLYQSKLISKVQYDKALEELIKPYK